MEASGQICQRYRFGVNVSAAAENTIEPNTDFQVGGGISRIFILDRNSNFQIRVIPQFHRVRSCQVFGSRVLYRRFIGGRGDHIQHNIANAILRKNNGIIVSFTQIDIAEPGCLLHCGEQVFALEQNFVQIAIEHIGYHMATALC